MLFEGWNSSIRLGLSLWASCTLLGSIAWALPHTGLQGSALVAPERGLLFLTQGFRLQNSETKWNLEIQKDRTNFRALYRSKEEPLGQLLVRVEESKGISQPDAYAKRWLRDYNHFGFEVKGEKKFQVNQAPGYVMDLLHRERKVQIRQVVFLRGERAVILTCSDEVGQFASTLARCNSVIRSFTWSQQAIAKIQGKQRAPTAIGSSRSTRLSPPREE